MVVPGLMGLALISGACVIAIASSHYYGHEYRVIHHGVRSVGIVKAIVEQPRGGSDGTIRIDYDAGTAVVDATITSPHAYRVGQEVPVRFDPHRLSAVVPDGTHLPVFEMGFLGGLALAALVFGIFYLCDAIRELRSARHERATLDDAA